MTLPLTNVKSYCPPRPPKLHAYCLPTCTCMHTPHTHTIAAVMSSTQRQSVFFIFTGVYQDCNLSTLHADLQTLSYSDTHTHTHSPSLPLRPAPGSRYGFVKSWRGMNGSGEGQGVRSAERTLGSKLLCQSILPLGTVDETCPKFRHYFK